MRLSAPVASLQSSAVASVSRSGRASTARASAASSVHAATSRCSAVSVATKVLLAATLSSRPRADRQNEVAGAGERAVRGVENRDGQRPGRARAQRHLDQVVALARLRDGEEQLVLEVELPAVHAGDVGRRLGHRRADGALDQVLAVGRRMRRAAARAGDHDLRRPPLEARHQLPQGMRQPLRLPRHGCGGLGDLAAPCASGAGSWDICSGHRSMLQGRPYPASPNRRLGVSAHPRQGRHSRAGGNPGHLSTRAAWWHATLLPAQCFADRAP